MGQHLSIWEHMAQSPATSQPITIKHVNSVVRRGVAALLWRTLAPNYCMLCALPATAAVCTDCEVALPALSSNCCAHCAEPLTAPAAHCGRCLAHPPAFDATLAMWRYQAPIDTLVHALKYRHQLAIARWFGAALATRCLQTPLPTVDRLFAVPLSATRLAERGFNQSLEVARTVSRQTGVRIDLALRRIRDTNTQADLPWKARAANVRQAFACDTRLDGLHVLVIDDVMTTGATLNEVALALKSAGAARVNNLVVARTPRQA